MKRFSASRLASGEAPRILSGCSCSESCRYAALTSLAEYQLAGREERPNSYRHALPDVRGPHTASRGVFRAPRGCEGHEYGWRHLGKCLLALLVGIRGAVFRI